MCTLLYFEVMKNWTQVPNYLHYVFNNVFFGNFAELNI